MKIFSKNLIIPLLLAVSMTAPVLQAKKHCRKSSRSRTQYHKVLLDLEDGFWNQFTTPCGELDPDGVCTGCVGLDLSFEATLQITTIGNQVYIQVPALNFTIPETQNDCYLSTASIPPAPGGYVYLKDGFLPEKVRPNSVFPLTFTIQSSEYPPLQDPPVATQGFNYELLIDMEGRIKIAGQGFNPIPAGRHSLLPTTVSYIVNKSCAKAPRNIPISERPSTPNLCCRVNQFLEIQMSSFENGKVAFTFGDNGSPSLIENCNINNKVAVGDVVTKHGKPTFKFTVPQHTYDPTTIGYGNGVSGYQAGIESDVAINPTNTQNVVSAFSVRVGDAPYPGIGTFPVTRFACIAQASFDGGVTWSDQIRVDTADLICRGDVRLRTDPFGNFWVMFDTVGSSYDPNTDTGVSQAIFVSSDGGLTWNAVAEATPPNNNNFGFDFPMMHWGGDGNGGVAMYFDWMLFDFDGDGNNIFVNYLAAMPVGGLGGPFGPLQVINNFPQIDNLIGFGEITATPEGTVVYAAQTSGAMGGFGVPNIELEAQRYIIVHEGGLDNFTPEGFSEPRLVNFNTIGIQNSFGQHSVVWQATRGVLNEQGFDYDPNTGRLYALTVSEMNPRTVTEIELPGDSSDQASLEYNQGILNLTWSYDFGKTWSQPVPIRDSKIGQAGIVTLNVDSTTGNLAVGWYDPREDAENQQEIKWYATVLAPPADPKTT